MRGKEARENIVGKGEGRREKTLWERGKGARENIVGEGERRSEKNLLCGRGERSVRTHYAGHYERGERRSEKVLWARERGRRKTLLTRKR